MRDQNIIWNFLQIVHTMEGVYIKEGEVKESKEEEEEEELSVNNITYCLNRPHFTMSDVGFRLNTN